MNYHRPATVPPPLHRNNPALIPLLLEEAAVVAVDAAADVHTVVEALRVVVVAAVVFPMDLLQTVQESQEDYWIGHYFLLAAHCPRSRTVQAVAVVVEEEEAVSLHLIHHETAVFFSIEVLLWYCPRAVSLC
jgi:hypothetical protein